MKWAALIAWLLTAGFGFVMLTIWLARGGMRAEVGGGRRIRPPLILTHFLLAAAGLVVWIVYLAADKDALAWIAFGTLAVVAVLGWSMFAIWWRARQGVVEVVGHLAPDTRPEDHFPKAVIGLHGLLAVTTVVLVFLTAIGVGGS
jgi:hypothetical protein